MFHIQKGNGPPPQRSSFKEHSINRYIITTHTPVNYQAYLLIQFILYLIPLIISYYTKRILTRFSVMQTFLQLPVCLQSCPGHQCRRNVSAFWTSTGNKQPFSLTDQWWQFVGQKDSASPHQVLNRFSVVMIRNRYQI